MSSAELERFAADLQSHVSLRAEAEKAQAGTAPAVEGLVSFAATKGYAFTADDLRAYTKAKELTDAELTNVAGGATEYSLTIPNNSTKDITLDSLLPPLFPRP